MFSQDRKKKTILIIGSGISGLACAVAASKKGIFTILVSPYLSERSQSVLAAGGINGVLYPTNENDSIALHAEETLKAGCNIANAYAVQNLCAHAPETIEFLETIGVVFSRNEDGTLRQRAFGGQSKKRTVYAGASTGKQIVSGLTREARKYESAGLLERRYGEVFLSALIQDRVCYGVVLYHEVTRQVCAVYADAVVIASGGQNALFGKTTGSELCNAGAAAKLFAQGVSLKNLEFIQFHPTTIDTKLKRMLISEAARGEGGRLFYLEGEDRRYFMEEAYGERGNLMPRDIVAREINRAPRQVYLDVSFLGEKLIRSRLGEIDTICREYANLDIAKQPIPVSPAVHFFMGGISVGLQHQTDVERLYAVGECACMYHGANRLGGNSLLAAVYSGQVAASDAAEREPVGKRPDFSEQVKHRINQMTFAEEGPHSISERQILEQMTNVMQQALSIVRVEKRLQDGLKQIQSLQHIASHMHYDRSITRYQHFILKDQLNLAQAILLSALARKESRGAHFREDYPHTSEAYAAASIARWDQQKIGISFQKEVGDCHEV